MPSARVDDREIHYLRRGQGEPLLLVQGLSGTHLSWGEPFLGELERDFEVIAFDNRGVGRSARVEDDFTIGDMADDAAGLLDEIGLERAHVVGISMGGMIAQELVLRRPDAVSTLTLGCTYAGGPGSVMTPEKTWRRLADARKSGDRDHAIRTSWEVNVSEAFAADDEAYAAFHRAANELPVSIRMIGLQAHAILRHDVAARLGEISAPTLVVHGDEDQILPVENGPMIASRVPGARLEILEGVGHMFWIEQPERSAALIREHAAERAVTG